MTPEQKKEYLVKLRAWLFARLQEKSTWLGLSAVAAVFGYNINPEQIQYAVTLGGLVFGTGYVVVPDKKAD